MRTTEHMDGRGEDACADLVAEATSILDNARRLCADLAEALEAELDRLTSIVNDDQDDKRIALVKALIRENRNALQAVVEIRVKLLRSMDVNALNTGLIDLDDARTEIARQLARLAA